MNLDSGEWRNDSCLLVLFDCDEKHFGKIAHAAFAVILVFFFFALAGWFQFHCKSGFEG